MTDMSTFVVYRQSTFRHAYLVEAETSDQASEIVDRQIDTIQEWYQDHLGDTIENIEAIDPATLPTLHEETLRDKTDWWLPVTSFINHNTPSPIAEEDRVEEPRVSRDLERDLVNAFWTNSTFTQLVRDDAFMTDLYSALCNTEWFHVQDTSRSHPWACSWRHAGGVVSDIRNRVAGLNEDYMDYYCSGNEGIVAPRVASALSDLGWMYVPVVVGD